MGFIESKMVDEILEHDQVFDRQVFELRPASPGADLLPGAFGDYSVIYNSAGNLVQVNEKVAAAEYYYFGAPIIILVCRQIPDAQPAHADILDLPRVDELIGFYKSSESALFAPEPFQFSFFLKHVSAGVHQEPLVFTRMSFSLFVKANQPVSLMTTINSSTKILR